MSLDHITSPLAYVLCSAKCCDADEKPNEKQNKNKNMASSNIARLLEIDITLEMHFGSLEI